MNGRGALFCLSVVIGMVIDGLAAAQDEPPSENLVPRTAPETDESMAPGWHPLLAAGANFMLGHNQSVPGNPDGLTLSFGYLINGELTAVSDSRAQNWANELKLQLGYTRAPPLDVLTKSADLIDFSSTYLFRLPAVSWLGPFVSFRLTTSMLPGYLVLAEDANLIRLAAEETQRINAQGEPVDQNGQLIGTEHPTVQQLPANDKAKLTGAFAPLTLRESVGAFAQPLDREAIKIEARVGFGAWQTFVRHGYVVDDNEETEDFLELRQMQDSVQLGPEVSIAADGVINTAVTYRLSALFMQPIVHTADTELSGFELINAEFEVLLSVKLVKWASLDYAFKALKQPLVIDEWQIQNSLLLSLTATLVE